MTTTLPKARSHGFPTMLTLLTTLFIFQLPVSGQPVAADSLKNAIIALEQFQVDVQNIRAAVQKPLGPYQIHTTCTWCSERAWWGCGFCTEETTRNQETYVDFSWTRKNLSDILGNAEAATSQFTASFVPALDWITKLPEFSKRFNQTSDIVLSVQAAIRAGNGPTEEQRRMVSAALKELHDELKNSSVQLQAGTTALAVFLQNQSAYPELINQAINGADQSAKEALHSFQVETMSWRCQDGLTERFNGIRGDFDRSILEISAAFNQLRLHNTTAEKSLAALLGAVVSFQNDLQTVITLVETTGNDELGGFIEQLHLATAKKLWEDASN